MNLDWWLELASAWLPALVALAGSVAVVALARVILGRKSSGVAHGGVMRQLLVLALVASGVVAVILALPIGDSARGQLLSLLGLLLTAAIALSSTTFIGNAMAGLMLRALRNFGPGDFIRVGDQFGRVSEYGLLHTEIQTEERDLTTLPNLHLVTNPLTVVHENGTVVSAPVSLGYDVPRKDVERCLLSAAKKAGLADPFVRILDLGDFSVTYRVAGFLAEVKYLLSVRSKLRGAMLDALHREAIEIVSPTFMNQRVWPTDRAFVPDGPSSSKVRPIPDPAPPAPEERIFDKAEQAESRNQQRSDLDALNDEIERLEKAMNDTDPDTRDPLAAELDGVRARREALAATLAEQNADESEG